MSFSIPVAEDIGPPPQELLDGSVEPIEGGLASQSLGGDGGEEPRRLIMDRRALFGRAQPLAVQPFGPMDPRAPFPINSLIGAGGGGDDDKRDVISVSQCCNMMETEEVSSLEARLPDFGIINSHFRFSN